MSSSPLAHLLANYFNLSFDNKEIVCTSSPEADLENNCLFNDALKNAIKEAKLSIVLISYNYLASDYCRYELGAIWAASEETFIFNPQSIQRDNLPEIVVGRKYSNLDEEGLDALRDKMVSLKFEPKDKNISVWTSLKKRTLKEINNQSALADEPEEIDPEDAFDRLGEDKQDNGLAIGADIFER